MHLRTFLNWAIKEGWLHASPLWTIPIPRERKKLAEFLTPSQLELLFRAIDADYEMKRKSGYAREGEILCIKDLILVAVSTGLRRSELCNLRRSHVDFESRFINVRNDLDFITKSGNERSIPMVGDALSVLTRMRDARTVESDTYVFRGVRSGKLDGSFASKAFKRYVRLAMLPENIRFHSLRHSLRHTCASWLVTPGVHLSIVQQILGNSNIQVTQRYAHLAPDVMKAAMEQAFAR